MREVLFDPAGRAVVRRQQDLVAISGPSSLVGARLKCHRVCKVEMTPGRQGGLTRPHLSPKFCAMDAPLSAYLAPPDCLAAAGVVDRPADGSADMKLAARARMPAPR